MDINQLEVLVTVAQEQSFSRAARNCIARSRRSARRFAGLSWSLVSRFLIVRPKTAP